MNLFDNQFLLSLRLRLCDPRINIETRSSHESNKIIFYIAVEKQYFNCRDCIVKDKALAEVIKNIFSHLNILTLLRRACGFVYHY